jgi:GNAT superfamily N-acetyltransferase
MMASVPTTMRGAQSASASAGEQRTQACRVPTEAARLTARLTLRDGSTVAMRAIHADDTERLRAFHSRLSPDTIYFRFFSLLPELMPQMAERLTHVDYENRMALVATTGAGDDEQIVAVVRYERAGPTVAEVAFVVQDEWQGRGIATALLHRLAAYARGRGIVELLALTMSANTRMHRLLRDCGFPARSSHADGLMEVRLDISQPPAPAYAQ